MTTQAVLLHGFLGCGEDFAALLPALDRTAVAPDLPGHGAPPAPLTGEDFAAGIRAATRTIANACAAPVHLAGYSMGGRIALAVAAEAPHLVRSLTLCSAHPGLASATEREARRTADAERATALERDLEGFLDRWYRQPLFAPLRRREGFAAVRARRARGDASALARALRVYSTGAQPDLRPSLTRTGPPVLYLSGSDDAKFAALGAELAALPRVTHRSLDGVGHAIPQEAPDALAAELVRFWQAVEAAEAAR